MSQDSKPAINAHLGDTEWIRRRLEQMEKDRQAGKWPEDVETIVRRLEYDSYEHYRRSPLWRKIRKRIMERDQQTCFRCGEPAKEVHHRGYTEAGMKGEDDSLLISLCAACHHEVEFDNKGRRRNNKEEILANTARRAPKPFSSQIREASDSRCFWCQGRTDTPPWAPLGTVSAIPTERGDHEEVWMCSVCDSTLGFDEDGRTRSDDEKIKLLSKRAKRSYHRRKPSRVFRFNNGFRKLNAIQRELLMGDWERNTVNRPAQQ